MTFVIFEPSETVSAFVSLARWLTLHIMSVPRGSSPSSSASASAPPSALFSQATLTVRDCYSSVRDALVLNTRDESFSAQSSASASHLKVTPNKRPRASGRRKSNRSRNQPRCFVSHTVTIDQRALLAHDKIDKQADRARRALARGNGCGPTAHTLLALALPTNIVISARYGHGQALDSLSLRNRTPPSISINCTLNTVQFARAASAIDVKIAPLSATERWRSTASFRFASSLPSRCSTLKKHTRYKCHLCVSFTVCLTRPVVVLAVLRLLTFVFRSVFASLSRLAVFEKR